MSKLLELRQQLGAAVDYLASDECVRDAKTYETQEAVILELEGHITRFEKAQERYAALAKPAQATSNDNDGEAAYLAGREYMPDDISRGWRTAAEQRLAPERREFQSFVRDARKATGFQFHKDKHFGTLGEQLRAIQQYYESRGAMADGRLVRAPTGLNEGDPSAGGFLVQTDFAAAVFMRAYEMGTILNATQKLTISTGANGIKIPGIDETSRLTGSRWGGVQSYWVAEGTAVTASRPKFRLIELDLKKLMSVMYCTDEELADTALLTGIASQAFSEELMFMSEDAFVEGTGAGQPLGILNAPCLVTVAKEVGQAAGTIVKENIDKMYSRIWSRSLQNAVWYINQDCTPSLNSLAQAVGTGGIPVYLPPGGTYSNSPYGTLLGRPVVPVEYCSTVGTIGDIVLGDFGQYVVAQKGGMQAATSMHVAFLTDEMVFRMTYRIDGQPIWHNVLTPFKGSNTKSPFVVLASR